MKKTAFLLFSLFATISVSAQEVVTTQGDSYSNASGNIDFTLGEVVINTGTDGTNDLTQGFHQTNWSFVSIENHITNYEAIIFPNPTDDFLNIQSISFKNVNYSLFDEMGKLVLNGTLYTEKTSLDVSKLQTGSYSLILNRSENKLKTFNIIKTR